MLESFEALQILILLMPGFITQGIIHVLTTRQARSAFVHIVAALGWTLGNYFLLGVVIWALGITVDWNVGGHMPTNVLLISLNRQFVLLLGILLFVSFCTGLICALFINNRWVYRAAKAFHITKKTGRQEVWLDVLEGYTKRWLSVELEDGSLLIGYAKYFSYHPEPRELFLGDVEIVTKEGKRDVVEGILLSDWSKVKKLIVLREDKSDEHDGAQASEREKEADTSVP